MVFMCPKKGEKQGAVGEGCSEESRVVKVGLVGVINGQGSSVGINYTKRL